MSAPARIGPYLVEGELGRGGMGVVYRARHPEIPRPLALKLIRPDLADEETLLRFGREAQLMARITHPGLVRVHQLGRAPEGPFIVSELIEGEGLDDLAARGALDARRAAELVAALAEAIGALHAAGVLHRDLKPANVRVRPDGSPVVLDLGIAHDASAERLTVTGQMIGTPAYMSPEQASGERGAVGPAADVYGLGAILFELLAGERPFAEREGVALITAIFQHEPRWPGARPEREVPPELDAVVRKAMTKEPGERYASAAALGEDLARYLAGEVPLAAGELALARARRRRAWIAAFAAGVVGILAVGGLIAAQIESTAPLTDGASVSAEGAAPVDTAVRYDETVGSRARASLLRRWLDRQPTDPEALARRERLRETALQQAPDRVLQRRHAGEPPRMRARRFDGPWGQVVVLATDTRVDVPVLEGVWLADPKTSFEFTPTPWGWQAIDLAPWGPGALVCFARSELRVLDLGANTLGEPLRLDVPLDPTTIAVAPDQRRAVVGFGHTGRGEQRGALRLFELVEGALRPSDWQPEVRFPVKTALFVAPQRLLVAGGRDAKGAEFGQGELVLYDLEARRSLMTIPSPVASFTLLRAQPHTQRVLVVNELGELHLIDLERLDEDPWDQPLRDESPAVEGLPGRRAHAHEIWDAQFSPDGARLYTVAGRSNRAGTGELKVWDLEGMELLDERLRYGPVLRSIVLHPEGLLTTAEDEEARARVLELWPIGPP